MTGPSTSNAVIVAASPQVAYAACLDPDALLAWLPPADMTGSFHHFEAREGGGYRMSLFYSESETAYRGKTGEREDRVDVRFLKLDPGRRIEDAISFVTDDPQLKGEIHRVTTFEPVPDGTLVTMTFENLPPGLDPRDNAKGTEISLGQLARYLAGPR